MHWWKWICFATCLQGASLVKSTETEDMSEKLSTSMKEENRNGVSQDVSDNSNNTKLEMYSDQPVSIYAVYVKHLLYRTCAVDRRYHNESDDAHHKERCAHNRNSSSVHNKQTMVMNMTSFVTYLNQQHDDACAAVLFYATWCPFSMKMTPSYNALGRVFTNLDIIAVDVVSQTNSFMTKYGTVAIPTLLLFHGKRVFSSYTLPNTTLVALLEYVTKNTKLSPPQHGADYETIIGLGGPVPTELVRRTNWVLIGSVLFIALFSIQQVLAAKWQNLAIIGNPFR